MTQVLRYVGCLFVAISLSAQEQATVNSPTPVTIDQTVTNHEIISITLARAPDWKLEIQYKDNLGKIHTDLHLGVVNETNPTGADVIVKSMNKMDFRTVSIERRAMIHLEGEGKIPPSTITGTPR